jgi:hypothetical protein
MTAGQLSAEQWLRDKITAGLLGGGTRILLSMSLIDNIIMNYIACSELYYNNV